MSSLLSLALQRQCCLEVHDRGADAKVTVGRDRNVDKPRYTAEGASLVQAFLRMTNRAGFSARLASPAQITHTGWFRPQRWVRGNFYEMPQPKQSLSCVQMSAPKASAEATVCQSSGSVGFVV